MARDLTRKAETMRKWRAKNAKHLRDYERATKVRRYARARARLKDPAKRAVSIARSAQFRARNPTWGRNHYRENLHHFTGDGKWSTRAVLARRAWRKWVRTMAVNRRLFGISDQVNSFDRS